MEKLKPTTVELEQTDLGTLLGKLASLLRNDGLSLIGRASLEARPGDEEYRDLAELWASLERTADLLDAAKKRLCRDCALLDVSETVSFGKKPR